MKMSASLPLLIALLQVVLAIGAGCKSSSYKKEQEQAIIVAKQEAALRGWIGVEVRDARFTKGFWRVGIWRQPKVFGGMALVEVSPDGRTVRFIDGK